MKINVSTSRVLAVIICEQGYRDTEQIRKINANFLVLNSYNFLKEMLLLWKLVSNNNTDNKIISEIMCTV